MEGLVAGRCLLFLILQYMVCNRFAIPFYPVDVPSLLPFMAREIQLIVHRGIVTAFGVFQTYYERSILSHESPSTISWIGSIQSFLLLFIGAVTGPLFDAGYTRHLLLVGWVMITLGLMMTSIASQFWQILLAQAFCTGLGCGCVFVPCVAILPQYFKRRRALANGIAATGSGIGGALYPIMFRQLQLRVGFPWATRVLGFIALATTTFSISLLKVRFQPQEKRSLIQISAFKDPVYALFCLSQFIGFCGLYNVLVYIQPFALDNNIMSEHLAFYLVSILNSSSTFGRIIPNYIAGYIGPLNVMIPMTFGASALALGWIGVHSTSGIFAFVVLYGFTSGGFVSIPPIVLISITPDLRDFGTRLGMSFVVCAVGALIGTPIGGAIMHETGGNYMGISLLAGICMFGSACVMMAARLIKTGPHLFVRA